MRDVPRLLIPVHVAVAGGVECEMACCAAEKRPRRLLLRRVQPSKYRKAPAEKRLARLSVEPPAVSRHIIFVQRFVVKKDIRSLQTYIVKSPVWCDLFLQFFRKFVKNQIPEMLMRIS